MALAYTYDDGLIGTVPVSEQPEALQFTYQRELNGQEAAYYRIVKGQNIFLPMIIE